MCDRYSRRMTNRQCGADRCDLNQILTADGYCNLCPRYTYKTDEYTCVYDRSFTLAYCLICLLIGAIIHCYAYCNYEYVEYRVHLICTEVGPLPVVAVAATGGHSNCPKNFEVLMS